MSDFEEAKERWEFYDKLKIAFSNGKDAKNVRSVGELIKELERLPHPLPVNIGVHGEGVDIVILNATSKKPYVTLAPGRDYDTSDQYI